MADPAPAGPVCPQTVGCNLLALVIIAEFLCPTPQAIVVYGWLESRQSC